jgi:N-acetylmuramoyl-L-alanine amidase
LKKYYILFIICYLFFLIASESEAYGSRIKLDYQKQSSSSAFLNIILPEKNSAVTKNYIEAYNLLIIDISNKNYTNRKEILSISSTDKFVKKIRLIWFNPSTVRVLCYLKDSVEYTVNFYTNVIRVSFYNPLEDMPDDENHKNNEENESSETRHTNPSEYFKKKNNIVVVIDPGHGGKDPGAVYKNIKEKDIVLNLAKFIKKNFEHKKYKERFKVYLTREDDSFLTLNSRRKISNSLKADIFISLHVNYSPHNPDASGTEIFFVSEEGAADRELELLLKMENTVDLMAGFYSEPSSSEPDDDLSFVLMDISKRNIINQSIQLSLNLEKSLKTIYKDKIRHIKRAPFAVLKNLKAPSTLIEIGFITNKNDRKLMTDKKHINRYASLICEGISDFYENTIKKITYPYYKENK